MLPTAPVPAAPARLDPLLMPRSSTTHLRLGAAVCDMRVLLLGLSPLTAAAAVMLAGCGVRGFTVADDGWSRGRMPAQAPSTRPRWDCPGTCARAGASGRPTRWQPR